MKKLFLVLLAFITFNVYSQVKEPKICGSKLTPAQTQVINSAVNNYLWTESVSNSLIKYPVIKIPVAFHVVYDTVLQNNLVTRAVLQKQIDILNIAYRMKNSKDINTKVPKEFRPRAADMKIEFYIDTVFRKKTNQKEFFEYDDGIKFDSTGGSNVYKPYDRLNIWVCNLEDGLLGYARFPGENDSIQGVALTFYSLNLHLPSDTTTWWKRYSTGKVAVHEVGHWLGLLHIWGDDCWFGGYGSGACMGSDEVDDTPNQRCPTRGCPNGAYLMSCGVETMYQNYMDYTDCNCMHMFTKGQMRRTRAAIKTMRPGLIK